MPPDARAAHVECTSGSWSSDMPVGAHKKGYSASEIGPSDASKTGGSQVEKGQSIFGSDATQELLEYALEFNNLFTALEDSLETCWPKKYYASQFFDMDGWSVPSFTFCLAGYRNMRIGMNATSRRRFTPEGSRFYYPCSIGDMFPLFKTGKLYHQHWSKHIHPYSRMTCWTSWTIRIVRLNFFALCAS